VYDQNGNVVNSITSTYDLNAFHPIFGIQNGSSLSNFPYGVEVYFYSAMITLSNPGEYKVLWSQCCRNAAIQNIPNPDSFDMELYTDFTVDPAQPGSTPYFMVRPVVFLPINTPWQYNPLPFDPDGDSLAWSLDLPHSTTGPITGYTNPPSVSGGNISIDPLTGTISWTASLLGNFVYTVTCEEYKNGIKVGEIRRDMQFIVLQAGPTPALMNLNELSTLNGIPYVTTKAGEPFNLSLLASDGLSCCLDFEAFGEPFILNNPMSYSTKGTDEPNMTKVSLSWSPTINEVKNDPYLVVLRISNGVFSMDYDLYVKVVETSLGLESLNMSLKSIYPNPSTNGLVNIPFELNEPQSVILKVIDLQGKVLIKKQDYFLSGTHSLTMNNQLSEGHYIIELMLENGERNVQQLVVLGH